MAPRLVKQNLESHMPRVVHFELSATDPVRIGQFFNRVFGWQFERWRDADYWVISTGPDGEPGIDGGLLIQRRVRTAVCNTIGVDSVDQSIQGVVEHGGRIVVPKRTLAGVGYLAYFQDTEGNTFGIMEVDKSAT
jgi:uncharacterized protein